MSNGTVLVITLESLFTFEPADEKGPAYLAGTICCACEDTFTCKDGSCEGGYIRVELFGADAEAAHAAWEERNAAALRRQEIRHSIARCYEQAAYALTYAREYPKGSPAKAQCIGRVRELRGTVRKLRGELRGAA